MTLLIVLERKGMQLQTLLLVNFSVGKRASTGRTVTLSCVLVKSASNSDPLWSSANSDVHKPKSLSVHTWEVQAPSANYTKWPIPPKWHAKGPPYGPVHAAVAPLTARLPEMSQWPLSSNRRLWELVPNGSRERLRQWDVEPLPGLCPWSFLQSQIPPRSPSHSALRVPGADLCGAVHTGWIVSHQWHFNHRER